MSADLQVEKDAVADDVGPSNSHSLVLFSDSVPKGQSMSDPE